MHPNLPKGKLKALSALAWAVLFAYPNAHAQAQVADLATKTETKLGLTLSDYTYEEPGYMSLKAKKIGLVYTSTYALGGQWPNPENAWFLRGDLSYSNGKADYQSPISGTLNGTTDWYFEARALLGRDFNMGSYMLAPFIGVGFRHLFNDLGYQRESNYTSLPIGVTHKMHLSDQSQLMTTVEYMHLIKGVQKAKLATQTVNLAQRSGYGLRLGVMKRMETWSFGPTLTYWNIGKSDVGGQPPVLEPQNSTLELGLKGVYHF